MSLSTPFIRRPVATTLLSLGLVVAGATAFFKLPVSPLPDVDIPTISVQATLPGASPSDVAATVASPLERHLGQIADVTEMTSAASSWFFWQMPDDAGHEVSGRKAVEIASRKGAGKGAAKAAVKAATEDTQDVRDQRLG